MTAAVDETAPTSEDPPAAPRLRWWHEVIYVGVFYGVYTLVRNQVGSASVSIGRAYANARNVIDVERALGSFREATVQGWFLGWGWFLRFWNIFYGSLHFVVTIGTLVFLFRHFPAAYPRLRNALLAATAIALVGFALFPMMPPRLLDAPPPYGAGATTGFVDTLAIHGGLWSFDSGTMAKVSNQYAAMPSLHTAWALWCAVALFPRMRRRWTKERNLRRHGPVSRRLRQPSTRKPRWRNWSAADRSLRTRWSGARASSTRARGTRGRPDNRPPFRDAPQDQRIHPA
jgi:hypothetical protein